MPCLSSAFLLVLALVLAAEDRRYLFTGNCASLVLSKCACCHHEDLNSAKAHKGFFTYVYLFCPNIPIAHAVDTLESGNMRYMQISTFYLDVNLKFPLATFLLFA